jgi:hypothetical protein
LARRTATTRFHSFWRVLALPQKFKQELAESAEDELMAASGDTDPEVRIYLCDLCALLFKNFSLFGCGSAALCPLREAKFLVKHNR